MPPAQESRILKLIDIAQQNIKKENNVRALQFLKRAKELSTQNSTSSTTLEKLTNLIEYCEKLAREEKQQDETRLSMAKQENAQQEGSLVPDYEKAMSGLSERHVNEKTMKRRQWNDDKWSSKIYLHQFGYTYESGVMVKTKEYNEIMGLGAQDEYKTPYFEFINQTHYDFLGDAVIRHLQQQLRDERKLVEFWLNRDLEEINDIFGATQSHNISHFQEKMKSTTPQQLLELEQSDVNIFMTPNAMNSNGVLLVLLQGSGVVRPPQFAMSLCINPDGGLKAGTMDEYMDKAKELGWEYMILNPNKNFTHDKSMRPIEGHENPIHHTLWCYDHFIRRSKADKILIVAHSYGGICVVAGLLKERPQFLKRLRGCAFTDSVHQQVHLEGLSKDALNFLQKYTQNYIATDSGKPVGEPIGGRAGVNTVSAGTKEHIWTSHKSFKHVFDYLTLCIQFSASPKEKLEIANVKKDEGNAEFKQGNYYTAMTHYARIISILTKEELDQDVEDDSKRLQLTAYVNMAAASLKLKEYEVAVRHCNNALEITLNDSNAQNLRIKAYFRKSQGLQCQKDWEKARETLVEAIEVDEKSCEGANQTLLLSELKKVESQIKQVIAKQKRAFRGMFE